MNKTKKFTVTAKSGNTYTWTFTEHKNEGDYGNGIYIGIETPSKDHHSLDCRYMIDYTFHKVCVDYLVRWYGDNFTDITEIE